MNKKDINSLAESYKKILLKEDDFTYSPAAQQHMANSPRIDKVNSSDEMNGARLIYQWAKTDTINFTEFWELLEQWKKKDSRFKENNDL